jgi:hypothetical protein
MGKRQWEKQRITVVYESPHGSGCDSHQSRPNVRQMDQAETHSRDQEGHQPELRREQREQPTQLGPIKCDGQPTMDFEPTMRWLSRRVWVQSLQKLLGGFLMLLGGIVLLATTWGFSYMVSLLALGSWIGYHHWFHSVFGLVVIPILFVGNARTSREYFSEYSVTTGTASGEVVNFYLPGVGLPSNVNPLAPDTMRAGVKMISDCLCVGPRVVTAAVRLFRKALRLRAAIAHHQKPAILSTPLRELPHLVRFLRSRAGAFAISAVFVAVRQPAAMSGGANYSRWADIGGTTTLWMRLRLAVCLVPSWLNCLIPRPSNPALALLRRFHAWPDECSARTLFWTPLIKSNKPKS